MPMEYTLIMAGIVLMAIELAVPGFGAFGIFGLCCLTAGSYLLLGGGIWAITVLTLIYASIVAILVFLCFYLPSESKWNPFVLWTKQRNVEGYQSSRDYSGLLDQTATTITPLRPAGTVIIGGRRLDVSSYGDYIDKAEEVIITKVEGSKIFVQRVKELK